MRGDARIERRIRTTESSHGIEQHFVGSREKSSRGSDSPRRPTRSRFRILIANSVDRLRNSPGRIFQRLDTQIEVRRNHPRNRAREMHLWSAVKSPLGAQTVLGDRHNLIYENLFTSAVGRLRNSPERNFQRLDTHTESRRI